MRLNYEAAKLKRLCENLNFAVRRLGPNNAAKLRTRMLDLADAQNVRELTAGDPHPLRGDRKGQLAIKLDGGTRLVIKPNHDKIPRSDDGGIDWAAVTAVTICFIGDYHD